MTFELKLEEADYLKAAKLHGRRWLLRFALPYFVILSALMFWISSRSAGLGGGSQIGFMVFLVAVLFYKWFVQMPARTVKNFRQHADSQKELTCTMDEEQFALEHDNGFVKKPWGEFRKWRGSDELILLYVTDMSYLVIPRRCLSAKEWEATTKIVNAKIVR